MFWQYAVMVLGSFVVVYWICRGLWWCLRAAYEIAQIVARARRLGLLLSSLHIVLEKEDTNNPRICLERSEDSWPLTRKTRLACMEEIQKLLLALTS